MAEVYGEKPKKFTREWWPYFWMYYKWHTIATVFVVMAVVSFVVQKTNEVKYDLIVTYMGQGAFADTESEQRLTAELEPFLEDATGEGEVHLLLGQIMLFGNPANIAEDINLKTKHDLEFVDAYSYLYIYDTTEFDSIANVNDVSELYLPVNEWLDGDNSAMRLGRGDVAYGISLSNSQLLKKAGINGTGKYLFIKNDAGISEKAMSEPKNPTALKNAVVVANELVK